MPQLKAHERFVKSLLLVAFLFVLPASAAASPVSYGAFEVVNSAGVKDINGKKAPLDRDDTMAVSTMTLSTDGQLLHLETGETRLTLYKVPAGLKDLTWNSDGTALLHRSDILALSGKSDLTEVETWGAAIDWPGAGEATMVMFRLNDATFAGFLISKPGGATIVRQMEFHQLAGPRHRPEGFSTREESGRRR